MISQITLRVYYQDTDAGGVVYHSRYLDFAERGRAEMLVQEGVDVKYFLEKGISFVLRHAEVDYIKPAKLDDVLTIQTRVKEIKNASMTLEQTCLREDGTVLVVMHIQLAFINPQTLRPVRMAPDVKEIFLKYVEGE